MPFESVPKHSFEQSPYFPTWKIAKDPIVRPYHAIQTEGENAAGDGPSHAVRVSCRCFGDLQGRRRGHHMTVTPPDDPDFKPESCLPVRIMQMNLTEQLGE